jgi:hypothetical protein
MKTLSERLLEKTRLDGVTGCLVWTGYVNPDGYGMISVGGAAGRPHSSHRVAWELAHGKIPIGICASVVVATTASAWTSEGAS